MKVAQDEGVCLEEVEKESFAAAVGRDYDGYHAVLVTSASVISATITLLQIWMVSDQALLLCLFFFLSRLPILTFSLT